MKKSLLFKPHSIPICIKKKKKEIYDLFVNYKDYSIMLYKVFPQSKIIMGSVEVIESEEEAVCEREEQPV